MTSNLRVLNWPDAISPKTIAQFSSEFDASVDLETFDSATQILANITGNPSADVIAPSSYNVTELAEQGLLEPLNHDRLPNMTHVDERSVSQRPYDLGSQYSIVKDYGTL